MSDSNYYHRPDPRREANRRLSKWERENEERDKGSFILRLPNGKTIRFKDRSYYSGAWGAIASRAYRSTLELVTFAKSLPTGFFNTPDIGYWDEHGDRVWWKPEAKQA